MSDNSEPISSKLPSRRIKNEFYRYYAGYPVDFAEWALQKMGLVSDAVLVDPWNGSGTTVVACAQLGISCHGYDINPVMVYLARARLSQAQDIALAEQAINSADIRFSHKNQINLSEIGYFLKHKISKRSVSYATLVSALFPIARDLFGIEKTKNPSWFRGGKGAQENRIDKSDLFTRWRSGLYEIAKWSSGDRAKNGCDLSIKRWDSRKKINIKSLYNGFLTSPPYLTRLDYVHATLPELMLLNIVENEFDLQDLRRSMLGTPLTSLRPAHRIAKLPENVRHLLETISCHHSKASSTYYYNFFAAYFIDLQASLQNLAGIVRSGANGCMVVQSSQYKDIQIDLPALLVSLAREQGLRHTESVEFKVTRSMSLVNSRAHVDAQRPKGEVAVFFERT